MLGELAYDHQLQMAQVVDVVVGREILSAGGQCRDTRLDAPLPADQHYRQVRPQRAAQGQNAVAHRAAHVAVAEHQVRRIAAQERLDIFEFLDPGHAQRVASIAQMAFDPLGDFLGSGSNQQNAARCIGGTRNDGFGRIHDHGTSVFAGSPAISRTRRGRR